MKGMHMRTGLAPTLTMAMALSLAACGGGKPDADGAAAAAASKAAARPADESVAAVLVSPGAAPAQLRFLVGAAPEPGKPFTLTISATAAQPLPELQLELESAGIAVSPASAVVAIGEAGGIATHEFTATPGAAGLAEISVRMRAGAEGPEARYAIPVLVRDPAAATAAPASDKADPAPAGNHPNP
jgi:hypothetical protein